MVAQKKRKDTRESPQCVIIVNDEEIRKALNELDSPPSALRVKITIQHDPLTSRFPAKQPFLFVLKHSEIPDNFFGTLSTQKWKAPVFVLDKTFIPAHSRDAWHQPSVVGYLVWNESEKEKTLQEILAFVQARLEKNQQVEVLKNRKKPTVLRRIGEFVKIDPQKQAEENLISLFVGHMREFMVDLKLICDALRPDGLAKNPFAGDRGLDLLKALHFKRAARLNRDGIQYDGNTYTNNQVQEFLRHQAVVAFFENKPPLHRTGAIVIRGESGTGKSLIARFIHDYIYRGFQTHNHVGPLKKVFCTNIGENLLESQLFGCMEGSFTSAVPQTGAIMEAYNGTLFLDEIGDLSKLHQAKLLEYLQYGVVSPMGWVGRAIYVPAVLVAATNRNLEKGCKEGGFREDLYHRLGLHVEIPPLRDRTEDMDWLVDFVLQNPQINPAKAVKEIEVSVIGHLKQLDYPGNFRQLEQLLRLAVMRARQEAVDVLTLGHIYYAREKLGMPEAAPSRSVPERSR